MNPVIKALWDELDKSKGIDFQAELRRAYRCCDYCYQKCLNSEQQFLYGYKAACDRLLPLLEKAVEMAELVSKYKANNGDDWPAIQAREFLASLQKENK